MDAEAIIRRMVAENFDAERAYERLCRDGQFTTTSTIEDGKVKTDFIDLWELYKVEPREDEEHGGVRVISEYLWPLGLR
jgi:hypothetical protein